MNDQNRLIEESIIFSLNWLNARKYYLRLINMIYIYIFLNFLSWSLIYYYKLTREDHYKSVIFDNEIYDWLLSKRNCIILSYTITKFNISRESLIINIWAILITHWIWFLTFFYTYFLFSSLIIKNVSYSFMIQFDSEK